MLRLSKERVLNVVKDKIEDYLKEDTILEDYYYMKGYIDALYEGGILTRIAHASLISHLQFHSDLLSSGNEIIITSSAPKKDTKNKIDNLIQGLKTKGDKK
jgi:hypothetical protein